MDAIALAPTHPVELVNHDATHARNIPYLVDDRYSIARVRGAPRADNLAHELRCAGLPIWPVIDNDQPITEEAGFHLHPGVVRCHGLIVSLASTRFSHECGPRTTELVPELALPRRWRFAPRNHRAGTEYSYDWGTEAYQVGPERHYHDKLAPGIA